MATLVVIQIVFSFFDRQRFYLLLSLYIFITALTYVGGLGLTRLRLFPAGGLGNDSFLGCICWLGLTGGASSMTAFSICGDAIAGYTAFFVIAALLGLVGFVFVLCGDDRIFTPVARTAIDADCLPASPALKR